MEGEISHDILTSFLNTKTEEEMMNFYQLDVEGNFIETIQTKRILFENSEPKYLSTSTYKNKLNSINSDLNEPNKKQKFDKN
jgi:hypothetical protein